MNAKYHCGMWCERILMFSWLITERKRCYAFFESRSRTGLTSVAGFFQTMIILDFFWADRSFVSLKSSIEMILRMAFLQQSTSSFWVMNVTIILALNWLGFWAFFMTSSLICFLVISLWTGFETFFVTSISCIFLGLIPRVSEYFCSSSCFLGTLLGGRCDHCFLTLFVQMEIKDLCLISWSFEICF